MNHSDHSWESCPELKRYWPPQLGDVWADNDGDEWIACTRRTGDDTVYMFLIDSMMLAPVEVDDFLRKYAPRLVYRREATR